MPSSQPQPSTTSPPEEETTVPIPGFSPLPHRAPDPLDPSATTTSPTPSDDDAGPDGWAEADVELGPPVTSRTGTGSSTASTERLDPTDLQGMTHALVGMASMLVRWLRARRHPQMHPGLWIADDEDQANIGDPLARIAARHAPISGEGSADVVDAVEILMGTTHYTLKNLPHEGIAWDPEEAPPADGTAHAG